MFRIDRTYVNIANNQNVQANKAQATSAQENTEAEKPDPEETQSLQLSLKIEYDNIEKTKAELETRRLELERLYHAAEKTLKDAADEAHGKISAAEIEAMEIKSQAWKEGFEEGRKDAARELDSMREENHEMLCRVIGELKRANDGAIDDLEEDIISLVLSIAKKVIGISIERDDEAFYSLINKALRQMKREGSITVRVSPEEYERLFSSGSASFNIGDETLTAAIVEDPALVSGGCVVESEGESLNAGVDSQLNNLLISFKQQ